MKTGWKSLMVVGAVLALVSSQVLAQPGNGWGRGPRHMAGPGAGVVPHTPGPMGLGMGGPGGGCAFCCPLGPAPRGRLRLGWWLDLTDEQAKQIQSIHDKAQTDANAVAGAVASARNDLHKAVISGATEAQIQAAATALGTAIGKQAAFAAKTLASARAVLTDEQRKELEKIQTRFTPPHRRGPMAGNGRGNGWGRGPNQGAGGPPWQHVPQQ
jgi:Spy/CpxP family protein refolding chaperone